MDFIVRIFVYGLIGIVPSTDGSHLTFLVLKEEKHSPFLASTAECTGPCAEKLEECKCSGTSYPLSWRLHQENLSISVHRGRFLESSVKSTAGRGLNFLLQKKKKPWGPSNAADTSWIADVGKAAGVSSDIQSDCLSPSPTSCPVTASLRLSQGTFSTGRLTCWDNDDDGCDDQDLAPVLEFRDTIHTMPYRQALAEVAVVELEASGDGLLLSRIPYSDGLPKVALLEPNGGTPAIELFLGNVPTTVQPEPHVGKHFTHYYELLDAHTLAPVPVVTQEGAPWSNAKRPDLAPLAGCYPKFVRCCITYRDVPQDRAICPLGQYKGG